MQRDDEATTNPHRTAVTVTGSGASRRAASTEACLVVIYGDDLGRRVELGREPIVVGRSSKCEVELDQESVSRQHCRFVRDRSGYAVEDLGSTNGTYVNDSLITKIDLRDGDQVKIGRTILKFIVGGNIEASYHEEIYRLMTIDGLTQVHNKRFFEEAVDREISRSRRYGRAFSLILFDIDHFKKINDTHGHLAGDAVLRQLGLAVQGHVRRDDVVARTGGEEFGVVAPEADREGALELAEKIRILIEESNFFFEGTRIPVTVSLGVAEWVPEHQKPADTVAVADEQLYRAKRDGRNRARG